MKLLCHNSAIPNIHRRGPRSFLSHPAAKRVVVISPSVSRWRDDTSQPAFRIPRIPPDSTLVMPFSQLAIFVVKVASFSVLLKPSTLAEKPRLDPGCQSLAALRMREPDRGFGNIA